MLQLSSDLKENKLSEKVKKKIVSEIIKKLLFFECKDRLIRVRIGFKKHITKMNFKNAVDFICIKEIHAES